MRESKMTQSNESNNSGWSAPWRQAEQEEEFKVVGAGTYDREEDSYQPIPVKDESRKVLTDGPWIGAGTRIPMDGRSGAEALELAGMDFLVDKRPILFERATGMNDDGTMRVELDTITDHVAVCRVDTDECLGVVGSRVHKTLQNYEHVEFADAMSNAAPINLIAPWKNGAGMIVQSHLARDIVIGPMKVQPYILSSNAHDGSASLVAAMVGHVFACDNMHSQTMKGAPVRWTIRHTQSMGDRMKMAAATLRKAGQYWDRFEEHGRELLAMKMTPAQFSQILDTLMPIPQGKTKQDGTYVPPSPRSMTVAERKREEVRGIYASSMVGDLQGTALGVIQAYGAWDLWSRGSRGRSHLVSQVERVTDGRSTDYLSRVEREVMRVTS